MSSRSSFEELATLFEGSGTSCAERAYRKALDKLTTILVEEGILHAMRLKCKKHYQKEKRNRHRNLSVLGRFRWRMGRNIF